jgi:lambda family phage minor tail protein L
MTTPTIEAKLYEIHTQDALVDLFCLDASALGGEVYYFSPHIFANGELISWGGQVYQRLPIGIDNNEVKASNADLPQPTLTISNVGGPLMSAIVALGDLTGAKLTHTMTYVSYLDGQSNPSTSEYIGPQTWYIYQLSQLMSSQSIQYTLACVIDRPGYMFPVRQVLRYPNINQPDGIYFPGVSPYRVSQYQSQ